MITANNASQKIEMMMDFNKILAELELNLKILFESEGINLYRENGDRDVFKNLGSLINIFKNHISKSSNEHLKQFWEKYSDKINHYIDLRNAFIHGNLYQALKNNLICNKANYSVSLLNKEFGNTSPTKIIRDMIVNFINYKNLESSTKELQKINAEIRNITVKYLTQTDSYNLI